MTLATDLLLAAWAFFLGIRLYLAGGDGPRRIWALGLIATAAAALAGGLWHGYSPYWASSVAGLGWQLVLVLIGAADALLGLALVRQVLHGAWQRWFTVAVAAKAGVYLVAIAWVDDYWLAVADYLPTLALMLLLSLRRVRGAEDARWLVAGVVTSVVAAAVQVGEVSLNRWINHNDLYHLVQSVALYGFYRAGRLFCPTRRGEG